MPKMATILDGTLGHCWSPFIPGSIQSPRALGCQVYVNGLIPMVVGDQFGTHPITCPTLPNHTGTVAEGSPTVYVSDFVPARNFDGLDCTDIIIVLSQQNVFCESSGDANEQTPNNIPVAAWKMYIQAFPGIGGYINWVTVGQNRGVYVKVDENSPWTLAASGINYRGSLNPPQGNPQYATAGPNQIHELAIIYENLNNIIPLNYSYDPNSYPQYRFTKTTETGGRFVPNFLNPPIVRIEPLSG